jgi:hypothetical protein
LVFMRFILLSSFIILSLPCWAQQVYPVADNGLYGYTASTPIPMKSKGQLKSLHHAEDFVKHLQRDNGEPLLLLYRSVTRNPNYIKPTVQATNKLGIPVKDKGGWIDVFTISGREETDTFSLYIDIYHSGNAMVPKGLKYVP